MTLPWETRTLHGARSRSTTAGNRAWQAPPCPSGAFSRVFGQFLVVERADLGCVPQFLVLVRVPVFAHEPQLLKVRHDIFVLAHPKKLVVVEIKLGIRVSRKTRADVVFRLNVMAVAVIRGPSQAIRDFVSKFLN